MSGIPDAALRERQSRRGLLALVGAGGAGALAAFLSRGGDAQATHGGGTDPNALHVGEENVAPGGAVTKLLADVGANGDRGVGFIVENGNTEGGGAIEGVWHWPVSGGGVRWFNDSVGSGEGVNGGPGVVGASDTVPGVMGFGGAAGVLGLNNDGPGVHGQAGSDGTPDVAAVLGEAIGCVEKGPCGPGTGIGVRGRSEAGIGVQAEVDDPAGLALDVIGRARFSTAGSAVIPAGQNSAFVPNGNVTTNSHISVTLVGDPGGRYVRWVARSPAAGGFTIHLSSAPPPARPQTPLTYLIVEPAI